MSKFLDELTDLAHECQFEEKLSHIWVNNFDAVGSLMEHIDSLGENAKRLLEIGIIQDELEKLGFTHAFNEDVFPVATALEVMNLNNNIYTNIVFYLDSVAFGQGDELYYDSPTWQRDLINYIKG